MRMLELTYFLGSPLYPGSFFEQPSEYAEIVEEFLPFYDDMRENSKQRAMWGGGGKGGKGQNTKSATNTTGSPGRQKVNTPAKGGRR